MAGHRMFSHRVGNSAHFLQMPEGSQLLFFHMVLRADDDGVVEVYPITKLLGSAPDSLKVLYAKGFIKQLNEDQVAIIIDWKEHNKIRADRKVNSIYANLIKEKYPELELLKPKLRSDVIGGIRHTAIKESVSGLPYNFSIKIRQRFIGKNCPLCNKIMNDTEKNNTPSIQHNIPLSKGGKHELGNISVICTKCNIIKKDIETDELNAKEVISIWEEMNGRTMDGQWTDNGQHKLSKVKSSKDKKSKDILSAKADEEFNLLEENKKLLSDPKRYIQIIGIWLKAKGPKIENKKQLQSFIKRNLRSAQLLEGYKNDRIIEVIQYLKENADFKFTLETVSKFVDEDLNKLNSNKILEI